MTKIGKDDFVKGFVHHHNHGSVDYTGISSNHVHQCLDVTSPPIQTEDGGHIHYTEGYVLFEDGHTHHYKAYSGPAIPVGNGMHVHYYDFQTTTDNPMFSRGNCWIAFPQESYLFTMDLMVRNFHSTIRDFMDKLNHNC